MWYRGEIEETEPLANNTSQESKKKRERDVQGSSNFFRTQEKLNCFSFERKELQADSYCAASLGRTNYRDEWRVKRTM